MKIVFFGLPLAAWLLVRDGHSLTSCILSPVRAPGRRRLGRVLGETKIVDARSIAEDTLNEEVERRLSADPPDLLVSWYWTRRLPKRWLERPRLGAIGVHPSLLPRHRGPDPFFWAIDSGDAFTGVSVHLLEERYDQGAVLARHAVAIGDNNAWQLARALDEPGLTLLRCVVTALSRGARLEPEPQDDKLSTWAPQPSGRELSVDWHWDTDRVLRRIRALSPVPGLALSVRGLDMEVTRAERASNFPLVLDAGEAAVTADPPRVVVRTGDGAIVITRAVVEVVTGRVIELDPEQVASAVASRRADDVT